MLTQVNSLRSRLMRSEGHSERSNICSIFVHKKHTTIKPRNPCQQLFSKNLKKIFFSWFLKVKYFYKNVTKLLPKFQKISIYWKKLSIFTHFCNFDHWKTLKHAKNYTKIHFWPSPAQLWPQFKSFFYNFFLSFGKFNHLTKKLFMLTPLQKIFLCFKKSSCFLLV